MVNAVADNGNRARLRPDFVLNRMIVGKNLQRRVCGGTVKVKDESDAGFSGVFVRVDAWVVAVTQILLLDVSPRSYAVCPDLVSLA